MSLQINLSPCGRRARRLMHTAWAVSGIAAVLGAALVVSAMDLQARAAQLRPAATAGRETPVTGISPETERLLAELARLDVGRGYGVVNALNELESALPREAQVRRVQYSLSDGTVHLDVEARDARVLSDTVLALENRFDQVRILERQEARVGKDARIVMRLSFRERERS